MTREKAQRVPTDVDVTSGMAMLKAKIDRGEMPGIVKGQGGLVAISLVR